MSNQTGKFRYYKGVRVPNDEKVIAYYPLKYEGLETRAMQIITYKAVQFLTANNYLPKSYLTEVNNKTYTYSQIARHLVQNGFMCRAYIVPENVSCYSSVLTININKIKEVK